MRIGFDVSPLTRVRSGVGNYTYSLLKHLLRMGTDNAFLGFSSGLGEIELRGLEALAGHRHVRVPTRVLYRIWSIAGRPRVDALLGGVDVYHATNYFLPPVMSAKRVVTFYDLSFLSVPELCSPKIVGPFSKGVRRFAHEADAILCCSEASKRDIVEKLGAGPVKVSVAYGAVDEDFVPMSRESAERFLAERYGLRPPFVLFVSTLEPRKNVAGLLAAFARTTREVPHALVFVGGMGWNMQGIPALIEELGLEQRVRLVGYVAERGDLPAFYSAADAFVFPSFYEGFGLPVLEAMKCGCPVISSDRTSLPEVGGEAVVYVNPEDVEDIAKALRRVLSDARLREELRGKGLSQARKFSWAECARVTMDVYRRLAG